MTIDQIQNMLPAKDFIRGKAYYSENRVSNMACTNTDTLVKVHCSVQGTQLYKVSLDITPDRVGAYCSCPQFPIAGCCKHIAAALIAYAENFGSTTDYYASEMLKRYMDDATRNMSAQPSAPARLTLRVNKPDYYGDYPSFALRVGYDKLYVVPNIHTFLTNVVESKTTNYGKKLTLNHDIHQFDEKSQKIIYTIMNEFSKYKSLKPDRYNSYDPCSYDKKEIVVQGETFNQLFDILRDEPVENDRGGYYTLTDGDPRIGLSISKNQSSAILNIKNPDDFFFFGNTGYLYAINSRQFMRCSEEFKQKVYPLIQSRRNTMQLALSDLPAFCSCVLPKISDMVEVEDAENLLAEYVPDDCTAQFYFDIKDDTLLLKLLFAYGKHKFSPTENPGVRNGIRRNIMQEKTIVYFTERYFEKADRQYVLSGEDKIYDFLTNTLDSFREQGEVYISNQLANKRISPKPANVGISVSDGLLTLTLDTGGFPVSELSELYRSMLQRRKYHKLKDGRYISLDDSSCEKLAEMSHMLQLSPKELEGGQITLPAYRALYLDNMLSGSEGIRVDRDSHFRNMIRNFKTLSESDYALPQDLGGVLRPYQQTGFQWLKTLEAYGFGGILADEMGLGKTLQVIAFLTTTGDRRKDMPNLVICPASLIYNWGDEMQKFAPQLRYCLILGNAAERKRLRAGADGCDVWVTSYELMRQDIEEYAQKKFYCCILDEAQHIKNTTTLISKAVKRIQSVQRFVLTGTPIENRLSELWNLFDFLMPGYLFTNNAFKDKLEKPIVKSKNADAAAQLRRLVQPFMLRRLKSDVLKELPPKQEYVRRISLSEDELKLYHASVHNAIENLSDADGKIQILAALTRLRQLCCDPNLCFENYMGPTSKLDACAELCEAMVENGHQILLFSQFTTMLERIKARLDALNISNFTLRGSTSKEQRAALVKAFNAGEASVFLISLKAGGTGLNLTAADVVIHFDPWWNQAAQDQATDRAHRIGQQSHVQVYKLIAKDTIEEKILELQERKIALLDTISGGEEGGIMNMSSDELLELLKI